MNNGMKREWKRKLKAAGSVAAALAALAAVLLAGTDIVLASGGGAGVVTGINTLKDTLITIIQAIGVVVIVWGVFELGKAFTQHDSASKIQAMGPIIGGAIMVAASIVVSLFV